eukprot:UN20510
MTRVRSVLHWTIRHEGEGVVQHEASKSYKGLTIMQGIFSDGLQLRLVDMDGTIVHTWPIDFSIFGQTQHIYRSKEFPARILTTTLKVTWSCPMVLQSST